MAQKRKTDKPSDLRDNKRSGSDRRKNQRFDTSLHILIRLMPDGSPITGSAVEIGPNGMRIQTPMPLVEASYVHITFETASNNTHAEGRVVWTEHRSDELFESGIDVQKWGGGMPGADVVQDVPFLKEKPDRRGKTR